MHEIMCNQGHAVVVNWMKWQQDADVRHTATVSQLTVIKSFCLNSASFSSAKWHCCLD